VDRRVVLRAHSELPQAVIIAQANHNVAHNMYNLILSESTQVRHYGIQHAHHELALHFVDVVRSRRISSLSRKCHCMHVPHVTGVLHCRWDPDIKAGNFSQPPAAVELYRHGAEDDELVDLAGTELVNVVCCPSPVSALRSPRVTCGDSVSWPG